MKRKQSNKKVDANISQPQLQYGKSGVDCRTRTNNPLPSYRLPVLCFSCWMRIGDEMAFLPDDEASATPVEGLKLIHHRVIAPEYYIIVMSMGGPYWTAGP